MKSIGDTAFIVQARLRSERLPGKMLLPFAGSTLADIALEKITRSRVIPHDNFFFAVHEPELIEVGERHGANIFRRTRHSADGEDLFEVYEWHDRLPHRYVVKINACCPFLTVETIDDFARAFLNSPHEGLFAVVERRNYYWNDAGVMITPWPESISIMNTKRVAVTWEAAHCLYAGRRDRIAEGVWMGTFQVPDDPPLFPMNGYEAFDIDYPWQFEMAAAHYERSMR